MKISILLLSTLFALGSSQNATAQDNSTGGGAGGINLPDGSLVIADPFVVEQNRIVRINPVFDRYLDWTKALLLSYSSCHFQNEGSDQIHQYDQPKSPDVIQSLKELDHIYLVDSLPTNPICALESPNQEQLACTIGVETYILRTSFSRLNLLDQTSVLVHERLHAIMTKRKLRRNGLTPQQAHQHIYSVAAGIRTALQTLQLQLGGDRSPLSDRSLGSIAQMVDGLAGLGETCARGAVWPNGGGIVPTQATAVVPTPMFNIAPSAFIGIGSFIKTSQNLYIAEDTKVVFTKIFASSAWISNGSELNKTTLGTAANIQIDSKVKIDNARIMAGRNIKIGAKSLLSNTVISQPQDHTNGVGGDVLIGRNATLAQALFRLSDSTNHWKPSANLYIQFRYMIDLIIEDGATIKEITIPQWLHPPVSLTHDRVEQLETANSPYALKFESNVNLDLTDSPFRGCLNRGRHAFLTDRKVTFKQVSDLELNLCTKTDYDDRN